MTIVGDATTWSVVLIDNFDIDFFKLKFSSQLSKALKVNKVHCHRTKAKNYTTKVSCNFINICKVLYFPIKFCISPKDL
jgi:hypothetical protein